VARPVANQLNERGFANPDQRATRVAVLPKSDVAKLPINNGWYAKQMKVNQSTRRVSTGDADEEANVALPPNPSKTIWR